MSIAAGKAATGIVSLVAHRALDVAAIVLAIAVILWHVVIEPLLDRLDEGVGIAALSVVVLVTGVLIVVYAAAAISREGIPDKVKLAVPMISTTALVVYGTLQFSAGNLVIEQVAMIAAFVLTVQVRVIGRAVESRRRMEEASVAARRAERSANQQRSIVQAAKSVTSSLDVGGVFDTVVEELAELLEVEYTALVEIEPDAAQGTVRSYSGLGPGYEGTSVPVAGNLLQKVVRHDDTVVIDGEAWRTGLPDVAPREAFEQSQVALATPMRWRGSVRGVLLAIRSDSDRFTRSELRLAEAFAEFAGMALGNALTLSAEQRRREESERMVREQIAMINAAKTITQSLELDVVVGRIAESMRALIGADRAGFNLVDDDGTVTIMIPVEGDDALVGRRLQAGVGLSGRVVHNDATLVLSRKMMDEDPGLGSVQGVLRDLQSAIAAPVRVGDSIRAVLIAGFHEPVALGDDSVRTVEGFAELAAIALDNAATLSRARKHAAESQALRAAAAELTEQRASGEVVARLVERACTLLGADAATIGYVDEDLCTRWRHATGMGTGAWREMVIPPNQGLVAQVVTKGEPIVVHSLGDDPATLPVENPLLAIERLRWAVAVPMSQGGERHGCLLVGFRRPHRFTAEEIEVIKGLADQGSVAMKTVRLLEERERANAELRVRFRATIDALASTLEARDGYTAEHSMSVSLLVESVGKRMGLDPEDLAELRAVARLHDIGKIGVPNEVLHKAGPLDEKEWAVMHRHPAIGERILTGVPGLEGVARAVRHEHEHFDGSGYPDGLVGRAIPLASRIVLACDAYHAMTSDRPYRTAMPSDHAVMELARCAGTQFDPIVVEALVEEIGLAPAAPPARFSREIRS